MEEVNYQTDNELMHQLDGHDTAAFGHLYDRYSTVLFSLIDKIVGDKELAEKILEDVFLILWKRIDLFDFRTACVYTWLVNLAKNKAIDELLRQIGKDHQPVYDDDFERNYILPRLSLEIKTLELKYILHIRKKLLDAINSLTDPQKYVLMLMYFGALSEAEIGEKLNIPAQTVRVKLQVAMTALQEKFERLLSDD